MPRPAALVKPFTNSETVSETTSKNIDSGKCMNKFLETRGAPALSRMLQVVPERNPGSKVSHFSLVSSLHTQIAFLMKFVHQIHRRGAILICNTIILFWLSFVLTDTQFQIDLAHIEYPEFSLGLTV